MKSIKNGLQIVSPWAVAVFAAGTDGEWVHLPCVRRLGPFRLRRIGPVPWLLRARVRTTMPPSHAIAPPLSAPS